MTVLMSSSQFHKYELFVLRHAWLNLRDKHIWLAGSTSFYQFKSNQSQFDSISISFLKSMNETNEWKWNERSKWINPTIKSFIQFILLTKAIKINLIINFIWPGSINVKCFFSNSSSQSNFNQSRFKSNWITNQMKQSTMPSQSQFS